MSSLIEIAFTEKSVIPSVRGPTLDVRICQIMTSKIDPHTKSVNYL